MALLQSYRPLSNHIIHDDRASYIVRPNIASSIKSSVKQLPVVPLLPRRRPITSERNFDPMFSVFDSSPTPQGFRL